MGREFAVRSSRFAVEQKAILINKGGPLRTRINPTNGERRTVNREPVNGPELATVFLEPYS
jgi:hypothetical protein